MGINTKKIRKAIAGGFSAGVAAALGGVVFTGAPTKEQVAQLLAAFTVGFFGGFLAVYRAPANAPTGGSQVAR